MEGYILAVCLSPSKGTKKNEVESARILDNWGIENDAHAGEGHRQVSLLPIEEINKMKVLLPELDHGDFAENLVVKGIDTDNLRMGDRIVIGEEIVLEVTQIGKECHFGCQIQQLTGDCIMPKKGIFTKVVKGGMVSNNLTVRVETIF
ncbi:MOSC domain-containing protein [Acidobacteriota bacterium]